MNQKLNQEHLKMLFTNGQGVILWRIVKHIKKNEYVILDDTGTKYVKKSFRDWTSDIEIPFANGSSRQISTSCLAEHLRKMVRNKIIFRFDTKKCKIASYGIRENELIDKLACAFPYLNFNGKKTFAECEIDEGGVSL
jgi:hypothetical protein